jgi:hypothetical protein
VPHFFSDLRTEFGAVETGESLDTQLNIFWSNIFFPGFPIVIRMVFAVTPGVYLVGQARPS